VTEKAPPRRILKQVRLLAWALVVLAILGIAALWIVTQERSQPVATTGPVKSSLGGPFTLIGGDGKPFVSQALEGKPYAIYFGFTRCGDVCPTTLSRLVKLRREVANDHAMHIVFVTIDPTHDGPKEVGQYASLFNAPIIGLTGSPSQIDQVNKQYGIYAEPAAHPMAGKEMEHTATALLFNRAGSLAGAISPDEPDADALAKLKRLVG
jgi:protein SCO1/2